jgi:hypothetical protein
VFLQEGQWHIFSVPRFEVWLQRGYSNALHFEHTLYLTEDNIEYLIKSSGLEVRSKKYSGVGLFCLYTRSLLTEANIEDLLKSSDLEVVSKKYM